MSVLTYEQHFAIFGQGPHLVFHNQFEFVNVVTDFFHSRNNLVVILDGFFADIFDFVNDFIERDIRPENNGQYILDVKA